MKALLIATFIFAPAGQQPVQVQKPDMVIMDSEECRDAMLAVVESAGLKNHVYSSSSQFMKARNGGNSVIVTCKPIRTNQ